MFDGAAALVISCQFDVINVLFSEVARVEDFADLDIVDVVVVAPLDAVVTVGFLELVVNSIGVICVVDDARIVLVDDREIVVCLVVVGGVWVLLVLVVVDIDFVARVVLIFNGVCLLFEEVVLLV